MRIALISDIHGNLPALQAVLSDLAQRRVDRIVNLGDSLSGPLWPAETASLLMKQDWLQLAGNHERQLLSRDPALMEQSDVQAASQLGEHVYHWLASLPATASIGDVELCHGSPRSDLHYFFETVTAEGIRLASAEEVAERSAGSVAGLMACGHSHLPRQLRNAAGALLLNPGSVGLPAYADRYPFPHRVENGSPDARYAIAEHHGQHWQAEAIAVVYDNEAAARRAMQQGRPDWAYALRTGYARSLAD